MNDGEGGIRPCMIAAVGVYGELKFTTIHRTFLRPDGLAKAEMESPRKFMPGPIPEGACIQVSDWKGGPLGVAEGIETAMSARQLYDLPVWAVMGSAMMEKWLPPACCNEVIVFGDNDENYSGQAAAFKLANRLAIKGFEVTPPKIPLLPGDDWNDVWVRQRGKRF